MAFLLERWGGDGYESEAVTTFDNKVIISTWKRETPERTIVTQKFETLKEAKKQINRERWKAIGGWVGLGAVAAISLGIGAYSFNYFDEKQISLAFGAGFSGLYFATHASKHSRIKSQHVALNQLINSEID